MNRNMESYALADVPEIGVSRSRFNTGFSHSTTFDQGQLVPLFVKEVLPGSTFSVDMNSLVRMATPIFPVMDNAVCDIWCFFVPNRLVWDHWKEFIGENTSGPWAPNVEYTIPQLKFDTPTESSSEAIYGADPGSLANHLYHVGDLYYDGLTVSDLPNRAYRLIYNEFFRSEAYQNPLFVPTDDNDRSFSASYDVDAYGKDLQSTCRLPDYFSLVLPQPQNGGAVTIPISGLAPVLTSSTMNDTTGFPGMAVKTTVNTVPTDGLMGSHSGVVQTSEAEGTWKNSVVPANLYANLAEISGNLATINELRTAFQIQHLLTAYQNGRRYREVLANVFRVNLPDSTAQVPEYLGGTRFNINISQVVQTSSTDNVSPQGNVSAYSMSVDHSHLFTKSFVEHGIVMCLLSCRVRHTYSQHLERSWLRKRLLDFYFPQFANIADQPIYSKEFVPVGRADEDDQVFGYTNAWSDYRTDLNTVSGRFTPSLDGQSLLAPWTFADFYDMASETQPVVASGEWLKESNTNVKQVMAVQNEPQFIGNFYFEFDKVLPMPAQSVPGLADHH